MKLSSERQIKWQKHLETIYVESLKMTTKKTLWTVNYLVWPKNQKRGAFLVAFMCGFCWRNWVQFFSDFLRGRALEILTIPSFQHSWSLCFCQEISLILTYHLSDISSQQLFLLNIVKKKRKKEKCKEILYNYSSITSFVLMINLKITVKLDIKIRFGE